MSGWRRAVAAAAVVCAAGVSAWAGTKRVKDPSGAYELDVPAHWQVTVKGTNIKRVTVAAPGGGARVSFTSDEAEGASLDALVRDGVAFYKRLITQWTEVRRERLQVGGVPAVRVRATSRPGGSSLVGDYVFLVTARHTLRISYLAHQSVFAQSEATFGAILASVRLAGVAAAPEPPAPAPAPPAATAPPALAPGTRRLQCPAGAYTLDVPAHWQTAEHGGGFVVAPPRGESNLSVKAAARQAKTLDEYVERMIAAWRQNHAAWQETGREGLQVAGVAMVRLRATTQPKGTPAGTVRTSSYYLGLTPKHELLLMWGGPKAEQHFAGTFRSIVGTWWIRAAAAAPKPAVVDPSLMMPFPTPTPPTPTPPTPPPTPAATKTLSEPSGACTFAVPADWETQRRGLMLMASTADGRANVVVTAQPKEQATLEGFVEATVASCRRHLPGWVERGRQKLQVDGRPALLLRASTLTRGVAMHADYVLVHTDRRALMVSINCPEDDFATHQPTFGRIIASIRLAGAGSTPTPRPAPVGPPVHAATRAVGHRSGAFTLTVPADWRVTQQASGVVGSDPAGQVSLMVLVAPRAAGTSQQLAERTAQMLRGQIAGWQQVSSEATQVSGRAAVRLRARAVQRGVPQAADYLLVVTDTRQLVLSLACPQQDAARWQGTFGQILASFRAR